MACESSWLACFIGFAQEFEVASVKVTPPGAAGRILMAAIAARNGGPGSADPIHINRPNAALFEILQTAYDIKDYQVTGSDWMSRERYDFAVVVPEGATKEQVAIMWRNLLTWRFEMTLHKIQKEFPVDELQISPRGHKLQENTEPVPYPGTSPRLGSDGKITWLPQV